MKRVVLFLLGVFLLASSFFGISEAWKRLLATKLEKEQLEKADFIKEWQRKETEAVFQMAENRLFGTYEEALALTQQLVMLDSGQGQFVRSKVTQDSTSKIWEVSGEMVLPDVRRSTHITFECKLRKKSLTAWEVVGKCRIFREDPDLQIA